MQTTPNKTSNQDDTNEHMSNSDEVGNTIPEGTILLESEGGHEIDLSTKNTMETPQQAPPSIDIP